MRIGLRVIPAKGFNYLSYQQNLVNSTPLIAQAVKLNFPVCPAILLNSLHICHFLLILNKINGLSPPSALAQKPYGTYI